MANERDQNTNEPETQDEGLGGTTGNRQETPFGERVGGSSEENMRGIADDSDDDELEDSDDLDDEEEEEGDGAV